MTTPQSKSIEEVKREILEEFDEKFSSPRTLWAQDEAGNWYGKKDVQDFMSHSLDRMAEVVLEEVISYIGQKEGWEESEDHYREHYGLPAKYK